MSAAAVPMRSDDGRMSLVEHLTELRDRLIKIVLAVVIGMADRVPALRPDLRLPARAVPRSRHATPISDGKLLQLDPLEGFGVRMKLAAYGGIVLAMPVILWQLWRFVTPGLYAHEKRYAIPFMVSALVAVPDRRRARLLHAAAGARVPPVDIGGDNIVTAYAPDKYFTLITYMMLAFGIGFEFPILLVFLQMAGDHHAAAAPQASAATPSSASACWWR